MKLNPTERQEAARDMDNLRLDLSEMPDIHPDIDLNGPSEFVKWLLILGMVALIIWAWRIG